MSQNVLFTVENSRKWIATAAAKSRRKRELEKGGDRANIQNVEKRGNEKKYSSLTDA